MAQKHDRSSRGEQLASNNAQILQSSVPVGKPQSHTKKLQERRISSLQGGCDTGGAGERKASGVSLPQKPNAKVQEVEPCIRVYHEDNPRTLELATAGFKTSRSGAIGWNILTLCSLRFDSFSCLPGVLRVLRPSLKRETQQSDCFKTSLVEGAPLPRHPSHLHSDLAKGSTFTPSRLPALRPLIFGLQDDVGIFAFLG